MPISGVDFERNNYFNVKRRRSGHLFQGRFRSLLVDRDAYLLELSRYIHLNPVRAGLVQKPEDYTYSSYRAYVSPEESSLVSRDLIWEMIAQNRQEAPDAYRQFVENASGLASPFDRVYGGMILGDKRFVKESLGRVTRESVWRQETSRKGLLTGVPPDIEDIVGHLASRYGLPKEAIIKSTPYRHYAVYLTRASTPLSNADIGRHFGISVSAVTKIVTRLTAKMGADMKTRDELTHLKEELSLVNG